MNEIEYNSLSLQIVETRNYQSIDWRPMDTAPKDGRRILLKCLDWKNLPADRSESGNPIVKIGQWTSTDKYWGCEDLDWCGDHGNFLEPNGWLPLPPV